MPTTSLVEQLYKDFKDYDSLRNVHRIYQGHEKETDKRIVISTCSQSINAKKILCSLMVFIYFTYLTVSLTKIMSRLENCKYRIKFTFR